MSAETVDIAHINVNDRRFCLSYPLHDETLLSSISKVGIIQPVMLFNSTPYVVITGFKRIASAMRLGLATVPSIVLDIGEKEALLYAVHDNVKRGLNVIEKAYTVEKMILMGFPPAEINETMSMLALDPHEKVIGRLIAIANAEDTLKVFAVDKGLSMKNLSSLMRFDVEERADIIDMFTSIHTTESTIREILESLSLAKIKKGGVDFSFLKDGQDAQELRKKLKRLTNPILSSLEERLRKIKLQCALLPHMDIKVDPFFEKEYIDILIRAKTEEEILRAIEKLQEILGRNLMRSVFELTKG